MRSDVILGIIGQWALVTVADDLEEARGGHSVETVETIK